jgi:hypothetical protein
MVRLRNSALDLQLFEELLHAQLRLERDALAELVDQRPQLGDLRDVVLRVGQVEAALQASLRPADVAERGQSLLVLALDLARRGDPGPDRRERLLQPGRHRLLRQQVRALRGIRREVVQLRARRLDEVRGAADRGAQLAEAVLLPAEEALGVDHALGRGLVAEQRHARQRHSAGTGGRPSSSISVGTTSIRPTGHQHALAGRALPRQLQHQRDLQRFPIQEDAVLLLPVVEQALAMVGQEHDQRSVVEVLLLERGDEAPDQAVRVSDLSVVGTVLVLGLVRLGRRVRRVRVEQVQEEEHALVRLHARSQRSAFSTERRPASAGTRATGCACAPCSAPRKLVEALRDAGVGAQHHRRDHGPPVR